MGRSVSYPTNAIVAFTSYEGEDCLDWHDFREDIAHAMGEAFPSMTACDDWRGPEDHAFGENGFAWFGMSEYCGLVAIWIELKDCSGGRWSNDTTGLQWRWLQGANKRLKKFGTLEKLGHMSNGEGVFKRVAA